MFGKSLAKYLQSKDSAVEELDVTEAEFLQLAEQADMTQSEAEFQLTMMKGLGSRICLGNKLIGIKEDKKIKEDGT